MSRAVVIVIACAALGVASAPARATYACAWYEDVTVPAPRVVGPDPVLYRIHLDGTREAPIGFDGPDGPVPWTIRETSTVGKVTVTAIQVHARRGWFRDRLVSRVRGGSWAAMTAVYQIGVAAAPPPPPRLIDVVDRFGASCSQDPPLVGQRMRFTAPDAVAFRVRWRDGTSALVPAEHPGTAAAWWDDDAAVLSSEAWIDFGHGFCVSRPLTDRAPADVDAVEALGAEGFLRAPADRGRDVPRRAWWMGAIVLALAGIVGGVARARARHAAVPPG